MSSIFPKSLRLRDRDEFNQTWRRGRKKHAPHFIVVVHKNEGTSVRLGITASRKTGNAVARNRIKRLVREYFRQHHQEICCGADISVIAKQGAARLDYATVSCELGGLFHDQGLVL